MILSSSRRDWIATAVITAACTAAVAGAVVTADIHDAQLVRHELPPEGDVLVLAQPPAAVEEAFRVPTAGVAGQYRPLVAHGLVAVNDAHGITAVNQDGSTAWTYTRGEDEVCSLGRAWNKFVVTYRTGLGCGDTVGIDAATGQYAKTRSAINSAEVVAVQSNDRVGTLSTERLDVWRSDMVRTIEYGDVEAKQEPDMQPHEECTLSSALTRKETIALTESCPDNANTTWLRFMGATPEDSRKPEVDADVSIPADGARLVAVAEGAAAVYVPGPQAQILSFNSAGAQVAASDVDQAPAVTNAATPFAPATADLPHHMSWFDGQRLYLFEPTNLKIEFYVPGALGTGIAIGDRLVVPTAGGLAVVNWDNAQVERTIPVDRGGYTGPVYLEMAGTNLVENRGAEAVFLKAV
ncbi:hypothetical protein CPHO_09470 [Corynebacterium phocae]|uniref:Secreted protein n=1 Tax=Corynebacterium phocae TaxID=161895 RepID=A0A1L7D4N7_9CORY|nr:hypothetical protein [Corynebacterium phocae]APT93075.1 hypothetical protein CPHO_09470 [Corynebacterium phocae]KAA8722377.1 hypothetical protein F4V58_08940 [Corynebacterium phocae]